MTNREKYLDQILADLPWGKFDGKIDRCGNCLGCDFNESPGTFCRDTKLAWLQADISAQLCKPKMETTQVNSI